jgi:hypothetical protein
MKNSSKIFKVAVMIGYLMMGAIACSSKGLKEELRKKVVIDNAMGGEKMPDWTRDGKVSWEDGKNRVYKGVFTVRGDQRVSGCYDLAKMEIKENLISEISSEIKGEINLASEGINEAMDPMINKSFHQQMEASIRGLNIQEQLFERYIIEDTERIDCFVMGSIAQTDYRALKNNIIQKLSKNSAEVANAMKTKQVNFFTPDDVAQ